MSKQANFFAIGIFVVAAFVIAVGTFIAFGSASLNKKTAILVATFRESTNGLREGAKVKAYGVEVGQVKNIMLHRIERTSEVVIPVLMEIDLGKVSNLLGFNSYDDFNESTDMNYIERSVKAKLQLESFVTGVLYVELVFNEEDRGYILVGDRFSEYSAVPTVPTDMQLLLRSIQSVASNLGQIDFAGVMEETSSTLKDIRASIKDLQLDSVVVNMNELIADTRSKINSPELNTAAKDLAEMLAAMKRVGTLADARAKGTLDQLDRTLAKLENTANDAEKWLDPSNAVYGEVVEALDQIADASRSLRILVEFLERNPNALITGREPDSN